MESNQTRVIPFDLVFGILTRLPVKSLLRFRCVSKLWCSTISSKHFVDAYLNRPVTRKSFIFAFPNRDNSESYIFLGKEEEEGEGGGGENQEVKVTAIHRLTVTRPLREVTGSVHGLICLVFYDDSVIVCNPSTRENLVIPPVNSQTLVSNGSEYVSFYSFGFDQQTNTYKILKLCGIVSQDWAWEIWLFTLGPSSNWRRIHGDGYYSVGTNPGRTFTNGAVHFLGSLPDGDAAIVGFNFGEETFFDIAIPHGAENCSLQWGNRQVILGPDFYKFNHTVDLWVLQDYDRRVWIKQRVGILGPSYGLDRDYVFVNYDIEGKRMRKVKVLGIPGAGGPVLWSNYTQNIFSLREFARRRINFRDILFF